MANAAAETVLAGAAPQADMVEDALRVTTLLACRAYLYTLFHKLFGGEPTEELMEALGSPLSVDVFDEYAAGDEAMAGVEQFLLKLREACEDGGNAGALLEAAKTEYTRLFIGPGELIAYPWESPYVSKQASVCQESTLAVRAAYRADGLEPRRLLRVPDDHVSLMCAFMAQGADRTADLLAAGSFRQAAVLLREQERFLNAHMVGWLPEYARMARRSKTAVLYPQMIEAASVFVKLDTTFLSEAAFWLEGLPEAAFPKGCAASAEAAGPIEHVRTETHRIADMKLFGLEDNELVAVADGTSAA